MKKAIFIAIVSIFITACTTVDQKNASIQQDWDNESEIFGKVEKIAGQECHYKRGDKRSRKEAIPMAHCITKLSNKYIKPVAKYPDILNNFRIADEERSKEYAAGNISYEDFTEKGKEMSENYESSWIARANNELNQTANNINNTRTFGKIFLGASQGYNASVQKSREEAERNRPISCTTFGSNTTCY